MLKIETLQGWLELGEYGDELEQFDSNRYISDAFIYLSDDKVDIYYGALSEWCANNMEDVAEAISELGWDGVGRDLYKATQYAQQNAITAEIYEHQEDILKNYALEYYKEQTDAEEIPEDLWDEIESLCSGDVDTFDEIRDTVDEYLEAAEDDETKKMGRLKKMIELLMWKNERENGLEVFWPEKARGSIVPNSYNKTEAIKAFRRYNNLKYKHIKIIDET